MAVLEVRGLSKRYGKVQALDGVDLSVKKGEVFGFLGPNGAGKTTFTKCVTGFVRPNAGTASILGIDTIATPHAAAGHIGLVPDQYDFYPNLTGRQHLDFYGRLLGMPAEQRSARIEEVIDQMGMEGRAERRVKGYSHGMKQRICIGQAIMHKPDIIFFDEPTNGLDPKGAYELREMIKRLGQGGVTVFLNSHLLHEVEDVCERVAILVEGRVRIVSRVAEMRQKFARAGTASIEVLNPDKSHVKALQDAVGGEVSAGSHKYTFVADEPGLARAVAAVVDRGGQVVAVERQRMNLEQVFLQVTETEPGVAHGGDLARVGD